MSASEQELANHLIVHAVPSIIPEAPTATMEEPGVDIAHHAAIRRSASEVTTLLTSRLRDVTLSPSMHHIPRSVLGDGNCMYRALSRGLFGTENHHLHVRLLTALEIIEN